VNDRELRQIVLLRCDFHEAAEAGERAARACLRVSEASIQRVFVRGGRSIECPPAREVGRGRKRHRGIEREIGNAQGGAAWWLGMKGGWILARTAAEAENDDRQQ
jgi:hypothetical protein